MAIESILNTEEKKNLNDYGFDLVTLAKENKLDVIIGREKEMSLVIEILARKTKCNPLLLGESGVGKSAVVEGIAQIIATGNVPTFLKDCSIFSLNYSSLTSNAILRGQFESRVRFIIDKIIEAKGKIILFIDEIHNIVSTQKFDSNIDLANMLKPLMARSEIRVIGATTLLEYRLYIERDPALVRRMQIVNVYEPSIKEAIDMLQATKKSMEEHHDVFITKDAISASVKMSKRYLSNAIMPDKAIDLIDMACSKNKLKRETFNKDYDDISIKKEIFNLELRQYTQASQESDKVKKELQDLKLFNDNASVQWKDTQNIYKIISSLKSEERRIEHEIEIARQDFDFSKIIVLENVELPKIKEDLNIYRERLEQKKSVSDVITAKDIAEVVSDMCGISKKILFSLWAGALHNDSFVSDMQKSIESVAVGQKRAAFEIAKTIYYNLITKKHSDDTSSHSYNSLESTLASFIFVGAHASEKNSITSALAKFLYGRKDAIIHLLIEEDGKVDVSQQSIIGIKQASVIKVKIASTFLSDEEIHLLIQKVMHFINREISFSNMSIIIFDIDSANIKMSTEVIAEKEEDMLSANATYINSVLIFDAIDYESRKAIAIDRLDDLLKKIVHDNDVQIDNSLAEYFAQNEDVNKMCHKINREVKELLVNSMHILLDNTLSEKKIVYDTFNKLHVVFGTNT